MDKLGSVILFDDLLGTSAPLKGAGIQYARSTLLLSNHLINPCKGMNHWDPIRAYMREVLNISADKALDMYKSSIKFPYRGLPIQERSPSWNKDIPVKCLIVCVGGYRLFGPNDEGFSLSPGSITDLRELLNKMSGHMLETYSGMCFINPMTESKHYMFSTCRLSIANLSKYLIERYIDTGEPFLTYSPIYVRGKGATLIRGSSGDVLGVGGLSLFSLMEYLMTDLSSETWSVWYA